MTSACGIKWHTVYMHMHDAVKSLNINLSSIIYNVHASYIMYLNVLLLIANCDQLSSVQKCGCYLQNKKHTELYCTNE